MPYQMYLLDMDGVCTDFVRHALPLFGRDPEEVVEQENMEAHLGITAKEFWSTIDKVGAEWWATMPQTPECDDILNMLATFGTYIFASSPSNSVHALTGKALWLKNKFGSRYNGYQLGSYKHTMSRPGAILIDDFDKNCNKFEAVDPYPGQAILVPRSWNKARDLNLHGRALVDYIRAKLTIIKKCNAA